MSSKSKPRGPWIHRFLIRLFTLVFAVLVFWVLGFFVDDIESIKGPDWQEIELEPVESSIREQVGIVVSPDRLEEVPGSIQSLIESRSEFSERVDTLREQFVFRIGSSIKDGAVELLRLAKQQEELRIQRSEKHA